TPAANAQAISGGGASADTCQQWLKWYEEDVKRASQSVNAHSPSQVTKYYADAEYDLKLAKEGHCSWATVNVTKSPTPTQPVSAPIGKAPVSNAPARHASGV
ncbi:MAG TPA: hypothetical protein VGG08_05505, partial [Solirubrobacteraceae bacterium]